ncbi:uncharacterized protein LOC124913762 [Impatiens glandulifera]|uniref:uncharacterized protein LOC124913762 n=1 Tax=Impatiens glandulifera TaxID=253017 RepID=UPI001FB0EC8A|nr:uncharacterized protein LOC124913762 [Impatiens glandulifera]
MGERGQHEYRGSWVPSESPLLLNTGKEEHWSHFDSSVNSVSFGFIATAVLISMFLLMAIFERFLRNISPPPPQSPPGHRRRYSLDVESQMQLNSKFIPLPSPKISVKAMELSVLMPGDHIPRFIAQPSPRPRPPNRLIVASP